MRMNDDWKNFTPRANPVKAPGPQQSLVVAEVDINDAEALRMLAKSKLVDVIQNSPLTAKSLVGAIKELLDRIDGKPAQSVALEVKGDVKHTHNVELSAELLKEQIGRILHKKLVVIENQ